MRRYIYTILFVFGTLFCQAFGVEADDLVASICISKGDTLKMYNYEEQIVKLLEEKEKAVWSGCCDMVSVELKGEPNFYPDDFDGKQIRNVNDWPALIIKGTSTFSLEVTYIRHLRCSNIPRSEEDAKPGAPLVMWQLFGKLLSNIDTARATTKLSDTAFITTEHKVELKYRIGISFPEKIAFKITRIEGDDDFCFDDDGIIHLKIPDAYSACHLKWIVPDGVKPISPVVQNAYIKSTITLKNKGDDYAYPIVCRAVSCSGDTMYSDTVKIGKPTSIPVMEDLSCVAANATSFDVKVKEPDERLSYHWSVEDLVRGVVVDTQQGASVTMEIPQKDSVKLKLVSTGGCKASDTVAQVLHRSVVADERSIYLQGDTNCLFKGDTLRLSLRNAPHEVLVWQSGEGSDTLSWNSEYGVQCKDSICAVSVRSMHCPETVSKVFNIREDFKVSLASNPTCIRANKNQVIKLASNGINPEVHWYGNGVEIIDTTTYSKKDSILLRLTNPGDPNLYVAVTARECGRESDTLLMLRPLPEKPRLDSIWNALTPCIPLGIADTIELRVQPQGGVNFAWDWSENGKFRRITEADSSSILVATNFGLSDSEEDKIINVNIYAYTAGCNDSVAFPTDLYARGAGLDAEWKIGDNAKQTLHTVGFYQNDVAEIVSDRIELDTFSFYWGSSAVVTGSKVKQTIRIVNKPLPFYINCLLTNKNTSCYSYYSQTIEKVSSVQSIATSSSTGTTQDIEGSEAVQGMSYAAPPQEEKHRGGFMLVPNPTRGNTLLYLEKVAVDRRAVIEILTEQGVCLYRRNADADVMELPTARFRSGLYFVRVRAGEDDIIVKKLIVQ